MPVNRTAEIHVVSVPHKMFSTTFPSFHQNYILFEHEFQNCLIVTYIFNSNASWNEESDKLAILFQQTCIFTE